MAARMQLSRTQVVGQDSKPAGNLYVPVRPWGEYQPLLSSVRNFERSRRWRNLHAARSAGDQIDFRVFHTGANENRQLSFALSN